MEEEKSTACHAITRVTDALMMHIWDWIKMPTQAQANRPKQKFYAMRAIPMSQFQPRLEKDGGIPVCVTLCDAERERVFQHCMHPSKEYKKVPVPLAVHIWLAQEVWHDTEFPLQKKRVSNTHFTSVFGFVFLCNWMLSERSGRIDWCCSVNSMPYHH